MEIDKQEEQAEKEAERANSQNSQCEQEDQERSPTRKKSSGKIPVVRQTNTSYPNSTTDYPSTKKKVVERGKCFQNF